MQSRKRMNNILDFSKTGVDLLLIFVNGPLGSGKTLLMTFFAYKYHKSTDIYSNYHLDLENAHDIGPHDVSQIREGLLLIDEAYTWIDSRESQDDLNKFMSKMLFQSRKRDMDIIISAQLTHSVDLRFRDLSDIIISAEGKRTKKGSDGVERYAFKYLVDNGRDVRTMFIVDKLCKILYDIYDTKEFPDQQENVSEYEAKKTDDLIEKGLNIIKDEFGENAAELIGKDLSKGVVKTTLLDNGLKNKDVIGRVYYRLKGEKTKKQMAD